MRKERIHSSVLQAQERLWTRRPHLHPLGIGDLLERLRGQPRDARPGTVLGPPPERSREVPHRARNGFGDLQGDHDLITPKLAALQFYQLAIPAPAPPAGSFDVAAATRGKIVFSDAGCAHCHMAPLYTEPGWNRHTPEEIGIDSFQADRSPDGHYRTTPLKGLWAHSKGGYYHDGRFATLRDVVDHYDGHFGLSLTEQKKDLVEFLKSL
jgi:hypothetical protein